MKETSTDTTFNAFPSVAKAVEFRTSNCDLCQKCQNPFLEYNCPMYLEIQKGLFTGEISIESAQKIGFLDQEKYQGKCFEFELEYIRPFPDVLENPAPVADVKIKVNAMNQTTLF